MTIELNLLSYILLCFFAGAGAVALLYALKEWLL